MGGLGEGVVRSNKCFEFMVFFCLIRPVLLLLLFTTPLLNGAFHFLFSFFLSAEAMCFLDCSFKVMSDPLNCASLKALSCDLCSDLFTHSSVSRQIGLKLSGSSFRAILISFSSFPLLSSQYFWVCLYG